ncbi:MAG: trehalose-6-phosphate synthase, partial [Candidatus Rokubacteria bacterium]|nr:trehalose-6-phosphate synthase [Candidatus Rokubacteria bacterium]
MRVTFRLLVAIWVSAMVVIAGFAWLQIREERQRLVADLERRATLLGEGLKEAIEPVMGREAPAARVERILKRFGKPQRGIAIYDRFAALVVATADLAPILPSSLPEVSEAISSGDTAQGFRAVGGRASFVYATPLFREDRPLGALAVVLDASHLVQAERDLWRDNAVRFLVLAVVVSLITALVVRTSVVRPMARLSEWTRALRRGQPAPPPGVSDPGLFEPLAFEVSGLARSLYRAETAAAQEAALRLSGDTVWTEERLRQFVHLRLGDRLLVVVSNREPVSHARRGRRIERSTPASGLVTAMEPVMRACGGVWVAHGSGDADRETADESGRLRVPEDDPRYTLRRVWLTEEEEAGYYYGFSNEGLWPLCHLVHTRPRFRPEDWAQYAEVNQKFAAAVVEEIAGAEAPLVLVQDYHFALLPALIKAARPDARVALFWHIPWPNSEAFGICPWQPDLLRGMLGADLIGFHTQYHCNNFLETVDRAIEARIDWEHFAVVRGDHTTLVKPFPISVAPEFVEDPPSITREALLAELGVTAEFVGVGVERVDYTKGLPERFRALGRFFERYPEYRERLVFVQLGAPSRTRIRRYQELETEVAETVREVNEAF